MNEEKINEQKIDELLQQDAQQIQVPESLKPEAVKEKLKSQQPKKVIPFYRYAQLAAAVAAVVVVGGVGGYIGHVTKDNKTGSPVTTAKDPDKAADEEVELPEKKQQVGELYVLASNYNEFYDAVEIYEEPKWGIEDLFETNYKYEDIVEEAAPSYTADSATGAGAVNGFSGTNVQVNGIDESDFVKTDGDYIYVVDDNDITIIDIRDEKMQELANIYPEIGAADNVKEIYLDENRLYVIAECYETNTNKRGKKSYSYNTVCATVLLTYDITDRKNPSQVGQVKAEGSYYTSRKVDGYIYLFTSRNLRGIVERDLEEVAVPYVQDARIPADCIYYRDQSTYEFIMLSVDVQEPSEVKDSLMVLDDYANVYVGKDAIYLYSNEYVAGTQTTQISKFSYRKGILNAVAAGSVKGTVEDTFAISEKNGYLRILTTDWTHERVNQLYILDGELHLKGKIDDIAEGESIYAARYIGDVAYFITYRNMDPLFVADLSDATKPKLLGSVEISGFSDYIQGYGDNKILGIGYETDEYSIREGAKLVMFDVSDPMNPVIQGTKVLPKVDDVPGTYYYKGILADEGRNLIGFMCVSYSGDYLHRYVVYKWNEEESCFENLLAQDIDDNYMYESNIRGLYAGDTFYVLEEDKIISFDMDNDFKEIDELEF